MQKIEYQNNVINKRTKFFTKKHHETVENLEKLFEKGVPEITMSEIASRLKISLRTLYEIAPSKDELILMTMDNILMRLGKHALDSVSNIESPIEKLEKYLYIVNEAVGPKFNTFLKDIEKINYSQKMADYHVNFISNYTQKLLNDAMEIKEIKKIDTKAFSILFSGIGREFLKEKNRRLINTSPEESANSITGIILNGIKLKN
ncbi:MAG: TetR/AcrR family transcriptional regulator [Gammaproteobacteria bacterium]|tara:strand:+ start:197 stop:808 length:612 start_codon:yes stop_codon:yes gene_type:complete